MRKEANRIESKSTKEKLFRTFDLLLLSLLKLNKNKNCSNY